MSDKQGYFEIPLGDIAPNPLNPRRHIAGKKFDELVDVFLKSGVMLVGRVPDEILKK